MKQVIIYCHNEEVSLFRDRHAEFIKEGDVVRYRAIKYRVPEKADLIVTLPHHKNLIREIFRGINVNIELWDGSKKGTKVVTPDQPKKEVTNGEAESKGVTGKEVGPGKEARSGQKREEEVKTSSAPSTAPSNSASNADTPAIPISRNDSPKS
jgi:hypothetical protein